MYVLVTQCVRHTFTLMAKLMYYVLNCATHFYSHGKTYVYYVLNCATHFHSHGKTYVLCTELQLTFVLIELIMY